MTGISYPVFSHTRSIIPRLIAFAICLQFHMFAVPRQQKIHTVNGCKRDVESIFYGFLGKSSSFNQRHYQSFNLWSHCQVRNAVQLFQATSRGIGISSHGFRNNQARGIEFPIIAHLPPLLSNLLVAGNNQITAHPRGKIADNRGFDVDR